VKWLSVTNLSFWNILCINSLTTSIFYTRLLVPTSTTTTLCWTDLVPNLFVTKSCKGRLDCMGSNATSCKTPPTMHICLESPHTTNFPLVVGFWCSGPYIICSNALGDIWASTRHCTFIILCHPSSITQRHERVLSCLVKDFGSHTILGSCTSFNFIRRAAFLTSSSGFACAHSFYSRNQIMKSRSEH